EAAVLAGVGGFGGGRPCVLGRRGVDGHRLAGGAADIGGGVDHPRLVGEARRVHRAGVVVAPAGRGVLHDIVPGDPVAAHLDLVARRQRAVTAGDNQRRVAADEVACRAGVGGYGGDRHCLGWRGGGAGERRGGGAGGLWGGRGLLGRR